MSDRQKITLNIEEVQLPISVLSSEEKLYRDAATLIQDRLRTLRTTYPTLPNEKYYYAMAMITTAVESVKRANLVDNTPYIDMIKDLGEEIDKILDKPQKH